MKKPARIVLISILSLVACLAAAIVWIIAPIFSVLPTGQLAPGLWAIQDGSANSFVIAKGGTLVMVDAGMTAEAQIQGFKTLGLDPQAVRAVLLTHGDPDHAGGAAAFPQAVRYLAPAELPLVKGEAERFFFGIGVKGQDHSAGMTSLGDSEILLLGEPAEAVRVQVIPTPGHTPGSNSYLVEGRWLFTGDLLMLRGERAELLWSGINNDSKLSEASLRAIAATPGVELLLSAHSGLSRDFAAAMAAWR